MEEELNKKDESNKLRPPVSFAPHLWGEAWKFKLFHSSTYQFGRYPDSALSGAHEHFERYLLLLNLSKRLIPELDKDYKELIEKGYSKAIHAKELAAIIDNSFCELYSSVDCTRRVIATIYNRHNYVPSDSTSKMFRYAAENKMDDKVPLEIRKAFENGQNDWFPKLKKIRDAINHSSIGTCSDLEGRVKGELNQKISYFHSRLGNDMGNVLVTDDVFETLHDYEAKVNKFLGSVFQALNLTLEDKETVQVCGYFGGRVYLRFVSPYEAKDFNSGRCLSREWFKKEDQPTCPYMDICGAYTK